MKLNNATIKHYRCATIPISKLKTIINLNEKYLREKPTWYEIDGKMQYFKIRNDYRLFTEQFFSEFSRQVIGLDTLEYKIASVRTIDPVLKSTEEVRKTGLLSENFQNKDNNYYLVSELLNPEISDLVCYGDYSLEGLLSFFKRILAKNNYEEVKQFLLRLFIADAFTMQVDRNKHNISFQTPRLEGISHKERLRPELIKDKKNAQNFIVYEDNIAKLTNLHPSKVYDNERILGVDHKNVLLYQKGMIWAPLFSFNKNLLFETQEQAKKSQESYDGLDPNLAELYMTYYKDCQSLIERLAYDDEYKKILENFNKSNSQITLLPITYEYITHVLEERRKEFQKVLKI